jgi:hypothetical protein
VEIKTCYLSVIFACVQFKPERWQDPSYATDPATGVPRFVPFGIGPKACVAQQLAMVQCKVRFVGSGQRIGTTVAALLLL